MVLGFPCSILFSSSCQNSGLVFSAASSCSSYCTFTRLIQLSVSLKSHTSNLVTILQHIIVDWIIFFIYPHVRKSQMDLLQLYFIQIIRT